MGRNKLIYTLADYALVIASDAETGGTWAGHPRRLGTNGCQSLFWSTLACQTATGCSSKMAPCHFPIPFLNIT